MRSCLSLLLLMIFLAGCSRQSGTDELEKDHPELVEARERVQVQDLEGAETILLEYARTHPEVALTHVQLGMLYQTTREPVKVMYHFRKYMDMRPESKRSRILQQVILEEQQRLADQMALSAAEKNPESPEGRILLLQKQLAETRRALDVAELQLGQAGTLPGNPPGSPPADWQREKLDLLARIRELEAGTGAVPPPAVSPQTGGSPQQAYTVQRGDSLSRISMKMYGEASQWRKILEANRDKIPNPDALKVGTALVIPQ